MNKLALTAALIGSLVFTPAVFAAPVSKGEVTKVDTRRNRVTVKHGPLDNLEMPAMTMVFEVSDPAMMDRLTVGRAITFTADRVKGKLTIVEIE
ncbi:copper-binding protein [Acuticoccus yangtzensis]|uniref:copper-binding protein n=1 Tax=Acuticoccus yangtzensis TaxID=1443441 RepID=UPI0009495A7D|nr:copper-binding protein [Acuticoccus yangtzensis]